MAATDTHYVTGSRGWQLKSSFKFLSVIVLCMVLFYIPLYVTNNHPIAKVKGVVYDNQPAIMEIKNVSKLDELPKDMVYQRFLQMQLDYMARLNSIPTKKYKSSEGFIDYGEPVKDYLPANTSKVKRILAWTSFFGDMSYIPLKIDCDNNVTCETTYNRKDLLTSDAIVMHSRDLGNVKGLPSKRLPHQRWVFYAMESPYHMGLSPAAFNGVFNFTLNYRYDSDVQKKYVNLFKRESPLSNDQYNTILTDIMASKSNLVSYVNSNCGATHTTRLSYIRKLQKHIPVDTYGRCGKRSCPRNSLECEKNLSSYKFYLAMENSHCRNYVSEKTGQPLFSWRAVPIVMGGADPSDYERTLPPGSYINTAGFKSPKELAEYLLILDKNPLLYERYHQWRNTHFGKVNDELHETWCNLCTKLNNVSLPVQTYRDFKGWYNQDTCHI